MRGLQYHALDICMPFDIAPFGSFERESDNGDATFGEEEACKTEAIGALVSSFLG